MSNLTALLGNKDYCKGIQKALNEKVSAKLSVDGALGKASAEALRTFQRLNGLQASGVYDDPADSILGPFILQKYLQTQDFINAATKLGVPVASVRAVQEVESRGSGFFDSGRCAILFERHIFYKEMAKVTDANALTKLYQKDPDIINVTSGGYVGGPAEWVRFSRAFAINGDCAMKAASWGLFQIMGFNYGDAGFPNVGSFVDAMKQSERNHLDAFANFIKINSGGKLHKALVAKDWAEFARLYNGSGFAKNQYDTKLAAAFKANS